MALLSTFALAACSDANAPSELDQSIDEDVAIVAADAALADLQPRLPVSRSRTVSFFDAAGNPQDTYNLITTASVHTLIEMSSDVERDGCTATIVRRRDVMVSGLEGEEMERTWNGTSNMEVTRSKHTDENGTRTYEMSAVETIENVVRGVPRDEHPNARPQGARPPGAADKPLGHSGAPPGARPPNASPLSARPPWPLSGTITRSNTVVITNGPDGDVNHERTVVITFNGTQFVTLTVNGEESELDLAARKSDRAVRQRRE